MHVIWIAATESGSRPDARQVLEIELASLPGGSRTLQEPRLDFGIQL